MGLGAGQRVQPPDFGISSIYISDCERPDICNAREQIGLQASSRSGVLPSFSGHRGQEMDLGRPSIAGRGLRTILHFKLHQRGAHC